MTEKSFRTIITRSDIKKGEVIIPGRAIYLKKDSMVKCYGSKNNRSLSKENEYIILLDNGNRVGGIYIMGDHDLHIQMFQKYQGKGILSEFMSSGWFKTNKPDLQTISCIHDESSEEFKKIKHLGKLAGLKTVPHKEKWG